MTAPEPEEPQRGIEYPPLENLPPAADPYAPVDYPTGYPGPPTYAPGYPALPPPVYPPPGGGYPPYPGQYGAPYDPYRPVHPAGTNGQAIAALVIAVIGIPACMCFLPSLIALALGFVAMGQTRQTGQAGHGIALAAVLVSAATLLFGLGFMLLGVLGN